MQHSLNAAVMHLNHGDTRVHFIDTPGAPDFLGQSPAGARSGGDRGGGDQRRNGIEPMAQRMMDYAAERHLDRIIIVNKIDAPGVDLPGLLAQIQATFGKECLPLNLPDAGGTQVVDCFYNREGHSDFGAVDAAHRALVEQVVEVDAGLRRALPERRRHRRVGTARAAGAGAARRPPDPGVLRLGRRAAPAWPNCWTSSSSCCPTRPRATRRTSSTARALTPSRCTPNPTRPGTCWRTCSRSR
jgi:hypothetical protein